MAGLRSAPPPNQRLVVARRARVHVHRGDMRVRHVRDEADAGGEKARVFVGARNALGEFGLKIAPPTVDTLTPTFSKTLPPILPANAAAAGFSRRIRPVPGRHIQRPRRTPPRVRSLRMPRKCGPGAIRTSRGQPAAVDRARSCRRLNAKTRRPAQGRRGFPEGREDWKDQQCNQSDHRTRRIGRTRARNE